MRNTITYIETTILPYLAAGRVIWFRTFIFALNSLGEISKHKTTLFSDVYAYIYEYASKLQFIHYIHLYMSYCFVFFYYNDCGKMVHILTLCYYYFLGLLLLTCCVELLILFQFRQRSYISKFFGIQPYDFSSVLLCDSVTTLAMREKSCQFTEKFLNSP